MLKDPQSRGLEDLDSSGQSTLTLHLVTRNLRQGAECSMSQLCSCALPTVLVQNCPTASFCDTDFTELRGGTAREQGPNPPSSTASLPRTAPHFLSPFLFSPLFSISISLLLSLYLLFPLPLFSPLLSFSFSQEQLDHFIHSFCQLQRVTLPSGCSSRHSGKQTYFPFPRKMWLLSAIKIVLALYTSNCLCRTPCLSAL